MPIKKLIRMGHEQLTKPSAKITQFNTPELKNIIEDLVDSMRHYGGAGIAAPQIGTFVRIFAIEVHKLERYPDAPAIPLTIMINPEINILSTEQEEDWEGCLSVPGYRGLVPRYKHIAYRSYDVEGKLIEGEATGFFAKAIQHELDHLDGILFPMRIKDLRNFGCDDMLWERMTGKKDYPKTLKQKLREHWDL